MFGEEGRGKANKGKACCSRLPPGRVRRPAKQLVATKSRIPVKLAARVGNDCLNDLLLSKGCAADGRLTQPAALVC